MTRTIEVPTAYYQQFDADPGHPMPASTYGGWAEQPLPLDLDRTAVVVMHAWDTGDPEEFPGWYRCVDYLPRAARIAREVLPGLLAAVRGADLQVVHVVGGPDYYSHLAGYRRTARQVGEPAPAPDPPRVGHVHERLREFRRAHVHPGEHNTEDVRRGQAVMGFMHEATPGADEAIVAGSDQLDALCRSTGVDHLVYVGFAINGCLLIEPCGMVDMQRRGYLCSTVPEAVTAIENRESIAGEAAKQLQLWQVALLFGFVYPAHGLVAALREVAP